MYIRIYEYDVNKDEKNVLEIEATSNIIYFNGNIKNISNSFESKNRIRNIINSNIEILENLQNLRISNYKGGRQKQMTIFANNKIYNILGNTDNENSVSIYNKLKEEIISIYEL